MSFNSFVSDTDARHVHAPRTYKKLSIHSFLILFLWGLFCWGVIYLFLCCVKVFLCKCFSLSTLILFYFSSLLHVNDMDREEGLGKNLFYKDSSSRKALNFPVENVSTEIFRGTLSSHIVSRCRNLCFSLSYIFSFIRVCKVFGDRGRFRGGGGFMWWSLG